MTQRTAPRTVVMLFIALTIIVQAGMLGAFASGGDFSLDFIAAEPTTYNHDTGAGGAYGSRDIGTEVVESLEGGDFECGDKVVFFTEITTDAGASGSQDIQLDFSFLMEPTGQDGAGFTDLISAGVNSGDSGNQNLDGDETASIVSETPDTTPPPSQDTLFATVEVTNLNAGDVLILRLVTLLGCDVGSSPTGNLQADLQSAMVVEPSEDAITGGDQTIPFKKVEDIAQPGINVLKSCAPTDVEVGNTLTFTITVQNTGNETLENVVVDDSLLGDLSASFANTLAAGASESHDFTYTVTSSDGTTVNNSVTASADGAVSGAHVSDTASCSSNVIHHPIIEVTKSCAPSDVKPGDTVTFTITIENKGDEALENITVDDSLLGDLSGSFADTLAVGASESHQFTYDVTTNDGTTVDNTVTAEADGVLSGDHTSDTDSCSSNVLHTPIIDVSKTCTPNVGIGGTVTYTITIENKGDELLESVTVVDSLLGDLSGSYADILAIGASESHQFTHTVTADDPDPLPNHVDADAVGTHSDDPTHDEADCSTNIVHEPSVLVEKSCTPDTVGIGDPVTYTITVTNNGNDVLENITVNDSLIGDLSGSFADTLAPGASESHGFTRDVAAEDEDPVVNTVTVNAVGVDSDAPVTSSDSCESDVVHPAIQIVKTANPTVITDTGTVTFTYVVTNIGDTPLINISVDDDILGHIGDIAGPLDPGQSATLTRAVTVNSSSPTRNVGTATGTDNFGHTVTDSDDATIAVVLGRKLVRTGIDIGTWMAVGIALMLAGLGLKFLVWYVPDES